MPRYRVTFLLETPLICPHDVQFEFQGESVKILFSRRIDSLHVPLRGTAEGYNWVEARDNAEKVIAPVLDAVALHRKVPMMLQSMTEIVKAEGGSRRRAVVVDIQVTQQSVNLDGNAVQEIRQALEANLHAGHGLVRWLRYSFRPITTLDRFIFSWFAFENAVGTKRIVNKCPDCGKQVTSHSAMDNDAAFALLQTTNPRLTRPDFDKLSRSWRNELRAPVFHGGRIVTGQIRKQMIEAMHVFVPPIESKAQSQTGFKWAYPGRDPQDGIFELDLYHFVEFQSAAADEFANNVPTGSEVTAVTQEREEQVPFKFLPFEEAEHW